MNPKVILVVRLSAMGDVALTLPVVRSVASASNRVVVVTKPFFGAFFENIPYVSVFPVDTDGEYRGLSGMLTLYRDIKKSYSVVSMIDLHAVIRSYLLSMFFRLSSIRIYRIAKGRSQKRKLIRSKKLVRLSHSIDRYMNVFDRAGLDHGEPVIPAFVFTDHETECTDKVLTDIAGNKIHAFIGIAPFAKHRTKSWGEDKAGKLLNLINRSGDYYFLLFGGKEDIEGLRRISEKVRNTHVMATNYPIRTELALISRLRFMISMDSSNMHLASLAGVKTLSVWGGTHPDTGFYAYRQDPGLSVGIPHSMLECRPCSIYGKEECIRKDEKYKCLEDLSPEIVFRVIKDFGLVD